MQNISLLKLDFIWRYEYRTWNSAKRLYHTLKLWNLIFKNTFFTDKRLPGLGSLVFNFFFLQYSHKQRYKSFSNNLNLLLYFTTNILLTSWPVDSNKTLERYHTQSFKSSLYQILALVIVVKHGQESSPQRKKIITDFYKLSLKSTVTSLEVMVSSNEVKQSKTNKLEHIQ